MPKQQAIVLFSALVAVAMSGFAVLHIALRPEGLSWLGWLLDAGMAALLVAIGYSCFGRNAPVFGRVIDGRGVSDRVMALTFDDGPSPDTTPRILDTLREAGTVATFFVLGKHVERHPELVQRMVREGHEVANHGWSHETMIFAGPERVRHEICETAALITRCGAPRPRLFRAPHGFRGPFLGMLAPKLDHRIVGWTTGVYDTSLPGAEVIEERSRVAMRPGAILLLHDGDGNGDGDRSQTADALPGILQEMRQNDLTAVTVSDLAEMEAPRVRSWRRAILIAATAAILTGLLIYWAGIGSIRSSLEVFVGVNLGFVGAAILANLVSIALKSTVWKAGIDSSPSCPPVGYPQVIAAVFVGFLMNSVLVARAGEVGRAIVLRRHIERETGVRVPLGTIAGTVVIENLVLGITLVALLLIMALTVTGLPSGMIRGLATMAIAVVAVLVLVLLIELFIRWRRRRRPALQHISPGRGLQRVIHHVERVIHELSAGHQLVSDPPRAGLAIFAGLVSWVANLVAIWFTLLAFGIESHTFAAAIVVFAMSNLVGVIQITPGNVGVFQVAIAVALVQSYAIDQTLAVSFAVGLQAIEVGLGAGLGLVFLYLEGLTLAEVRRDIGDASAVTSETVPVSG